MKIDVINQDDLSRENFSRLDAAIDDIRAADWELEEKYEVARAALERETDSGSYDDLKNEVAELKKKWDLKRAEFQRAEAIRLEMAKDRDAAERAEWIEKFNAARARVEKLEAEVEQKVVEAFELAAEHNVAANEFNGMSHYIKKYLGRERTYKDAIPLRRPAVMVNKFYRKYR